MWSSMDDEFMLAVHQTISLNSALPRRIHNDRNVSKVLSARYLLQSDRADV